MSRKQSQPRRLRVSFPPTPSPATSDRRAASYLARLREWRRQDRTSLLHRSGSTRVSSSSSTRCLPPLSGRCSDDKRPNALSPTAIGVATSTIAFSRLLERRAQAEGRCAVFDRALCAGVWRRPAFILPMAWLENCRKRAGCDDMCGGSCEPQSICEWAKSGQGRTFYEHSFASAQFDAPCSKQL